MVGIKNKIISNRLKKEFTCENDKTRLDKFLTKNLSDFSRSKIQHIIEGKNVLVNGEVITINHFWLKSGDVVSVKSVKIEDTKDKVSIKSPVLKKIKIIEETADYIVLEKPAGLIVHQTEDVKEYSLVDWLKIQYPKIKKIGEDTIYRPGIVHRLDKNVSGLMVVALSQKMFDSLKQQFKDRKTTKKYFALVHGEFQHSEGEIDFKIERSKRSGKMVAKPINTDGKEASTIWFVVERFKNYTLLDVEIKTGRNHQIRAHMQAMDHSVVGDNLYQTKTFKNKFNIKRIFLHAYHLEFSDLSKNRKVFELKLPKELLGIVDLLRENQIIPIDQNENENE